MRAIDVLLAILLTWCGAAAEAHPLGNSTVNRWAQLSVSAQGVDIDYVLDLAELPTLVESANADSDADGEVSAREWSAYTKRWALGLRRELKIEIDGRALALDMSEQRWLRREGEAGLATLRLEARLHAAFGQLAADRSMNLRYRDASHAGTIGWKEVVLRTADDVALVSTTLSRNDSSKRLSAFPAMSVKANGDYPDATSGTATLTVKTAARAAPLPATEPVGTSPLPSAGEGQGEGGAAAKEQPAVSDTTTLASPSPQPSPVKGEGVEAPPARASYLLSYFRLGMHHIATGWDHLLFLFGLLLLRLELRRIVTVVTAFTVAHSLTLGVAAAGWITPPSLWIEPTIALTIAWVGLLNLMRRGERHGIVLAFAFGLIHGFGFAGALAESAAAHALQGRQFLLSLASFNFGIEALQIALVVITVPLLAWGARRAWYAPAQRTAAAGLTLSGLGVFLFRLAGAV